MKNVKEALLEIANRLPDDCTWEDVRYQIYVWRKIEEGVRAIERGDFVSHEEVFREFEEEEEEEGQV